MGVARRQMGKFRRLNNFCLSLDGFIINYLQHIIEACKRICRPFTELAP